MTLDLQEVTLRSLESLHEFRACVRVQKAVWGEDFIEKVPPLLMMAAQKNGGVAAGAFDEDERLLGFVFGIPGLEDGSPHHWSHMLAVRPDARNLGLGRRLKLLQRRLLLEKGVDDIYWSYDPLVARNAHLNLNRLGARVENYVVNMYGTETGSRLHRGLGTDRLVVHWRLREERVVRSLRGNHHGPPEGSAAAPAVVYRSREEAHAAPSSKEPHDGDAVRIEVPPDIQATKSQAPDAASEWRRHTRRAFRHYLDRGYSVAGLLRLEDPFRCFYVLTEREAGSSDDRSGGRP